jgi:foldase protein PrsA
MKKFLTLLVALLLLLSFTSCAQVNEEKDASRVVAVVNDTDILKSTFNNYLKYYEIIYSINSASMPTDDELVELKQTMLTELAELNAEYLDAVDRGYTVDESVWQENVDYTMSYIADAASTDDMASFYSQFDITEADFQAFLEDFYMKYSYVSALEDDFYSIISEDEDMQNYQVAKVNGDPLIMNKFLYYLMNQAIDTYMSGSDSPETDDELQTYYTNIIENYAQVEVYYNEAVDEGIEITDDEITSKLEEVNAYLDLFAADEDSKKEFLEEQFISYENWQTYSTEYAKMLVAQDKITAAFEEEIEDYTPTDKEIQSYYDENYGTKEGETMYAKHILFSEDNLEEAQECADRAQAGEDFDTLMEEYQDKDYVLEASDLGRFDTDTMVDEFTEGAFALSVGEVSDPVKSEYGYHVIYAYAAPTLEDKTEEITVTLVSNYKESELSDKEAKLFKKVKVKLPKEIKNVHDVYIDSLYDKYDIKLYPRRVKN